MIRHRQARGLFFAFVAFIGLSSLAHSHDKSQDFSKLQKKLSVVWGETERPIASYDCNVHLRKMAKDGIHISVRKGRTNVSFHANPSDDLAVSEGSLEFEAKSFEQDCEQAGCAGPFYVANSFFLGYGFVEVETVSPYSHGKTTLTCKLVN